MPLRTSGLLKYHTHFKGRSFKKSSDFTAVSDGALTFSPLCLVLTLVLTVAFLVFTHCCLCASQCGFIEILICLGSASLSKEVLLNKLNLEIQATSNQHHWMFTVSSQTTWNLIIFLFFTLIFWMSTFSGSFSRSSHYCKCYTVSQYWWGRAMWEKRLTFIIGRLIVLSVGAGIWTSRSCCWRLEVVEGL